MAIQHTSRGLKQDMRRRSQENWEKEVEVQGKSVTQDINL